MHEKALLETRHLYIRGPPNKRSSRNEGLYLRGASFLEDLYFRDTSISEVLCWNSRHLTLYSKPPLQGRRRM